MNHLPLLRHTIFHILEVRTLDAKINLSFQIAVVIGTVRCLTVNERGSWMAAGFSNGVISVLDLKTGILRGQWRAHDAEILQVIILTNGLA